MATPMNSVKTSRSLSSYNPSASSTPSAKATRTDPSDTLTTPRPRSRTSRRSSSNPMRNMNNAIPTLASALSRGEDVGGKEEPGMRLAELGGPEQHATDELSDHTRQFVRNSHIC